MKIVILSGGVGGARFVRGVTEVVPPGDVTVVGNVGDDVEVLGMHVSPDLDSVLYALAGLNDEERGWGRSGETCRPSTSTSSPTLPITVTSSATSVTPRTKRAPPTPPESTTIFTGAPRR